MSSYAIISLGGKQYRVREGEWLLVDRLKTDVGKTFTPDVLLANGELGANGVTVTARLVENVLGEKIRIGKYKAKSGYKKHTGYRSRLSKIEIESIGKKAAAKKAEAAPAAEAKPAAPKKPATPKKPVAAKKPAAPKKPAVAKKPAAKKKEES